MAITGTAASGSITLGTSPSQAATYAGQNIIIPNESAGIGDIVLMNGSTVIVMAGQTYTATPSGYTLMGVIYGWEGGNAMICAKDTQKRQWATTATSAVYLKSIAGVDEISTTGVLRGGQYAGRVAMNIKRYKSYVESNSAGSKLHPTSIWADTDGPMSKTKFYSTTDTDGIAARAVYQSYEAYLMQMKPMGRGSGYIFSQKYHKGREYTRLLKDATVTDANGSGSYTFPAAQYCWNYGAGGGTYWLPDMVELLRLVQDDTIDIVNDTLLKCGTQIEVADSLWSSVRLSELAAWHYHAIGFSAGSVFGTSMWCRPVTLLKIKN